MGSQGSSSSNNDFNNSLINDEEDMSDYNGIKTDEDEDSKNNSQMKIEKKNSINEIESLDSRKKKEKKIEEKSDRVPVTFEWEEQSNHVYVTGSFCNWNQFFLMQKNDQGKFFFTLDLPKGIHQYKFKVDEEWKYNPKMPNCKDDNGNINNYIDTTNIIVNCKIQEETEFSAMSTKGDANSKLSQLNSTKGKSGKSSKYSLKSLTDYSLSIPQKSDFNEKAPVLPGQYKNETNINLFTKQNELGKEIFFYPKEKNILSDNFAYKDINAISHENINHLGSKNKINDSDNHIVSSLISRYRLKFTTFVYYKQKTK